MSAGALVIRESREADIAAIQAIYAEHVLHGTATFEEVPPDSAEMARRRAAIVAPGLPYLVAEEAGRLIGFGYAGTYRPRSAYRFTVEDSIYLAPDCTGRGIGSALLAELIVRSTALGMRQMIAVIGDSANRASIRVHERHGFQMTGVLTNVGLKFGRWLDTVIMQRSLGSLDQPDRKS
ncbi:MAG TPA: GNAT family N-acetyltransferase [Opitutaceae bacterium]